MLPISYTAPASVTTCCNTSLLPMHLVTSLLPRAASLFANACATILRVILLPITCNCYQYPCYQCPVPPFCLYLLSLLPISRVTGMSHLCCRWHILGTRNIQRKIISSCKKYLSIAITLTYISREWGLKLGYRQFFNHLSVHI